MPGTPGNTNDFAAIIANLQAAGVKITDELKVTIKSWINSYYVNGGDPGSVVAAASSVFGKGGGSGNNGDGGIPTFTGGSGDGGSGSGSGGSSGPSPEQLAAMRAGFVGILHSWGLPPGKMAGLINQAVNGTWSTSQFMNHVRTTKLYKQAFHGIGSQPGMTEGSYLAQYRQFKSKAQDIGHNLSRQAFGTLLKKGVDYQEWSYRVKVEEQIEKNQNVFNWYERELKRRGELKPKENLKRKDLWDIVTKQNSERFESIYEIASVQSNLQRIGFDLFKGKKGGGKGADITRGQLLKLIKNFETGTLGAEVENFGAADYAEIAEQIRTTIPVSQLYGYGLKKRDLVELKFGGPRAAEIYQKAKNIMKQAQAAAEDRTTPQLVQTEKGTKLLTGGMSGDENY